MAFACLGTVAFADCGPKPSITIFVRNVDTNREYYATLLCDTDWLPPGNSTYEGGDPEYIASQNEGWRAFYEYAENDEFYFLQNTFKRTGNSSFSWDYQPPNRFKVALYFPDDGSLLVSEIRESYAFDSYFTAKVNNGGLTVSNSGGAGGIAINLGAFLMRVVITIIIELIIAFFFGIRDRSAVKLILGVNVVTQLLLNIVLTAFTYTLGLAAGLLVYIPLEIVIFVAEAGIYASSFPVYTDGKIKGGKAVLYSLAANSASFILGGGIYLLLMKSME